MKLFFKFIGQQKIIFMLSNPLTFMYIPVLLAAGTFTACANDDSPPDGRDKFTGNYEMSQTCDGQPNPDYEVTVTKSSQNENEIIIQNLGSYGQNVKAIVQDNTIAIPSQEIGAGMIGKVTVSGNGSLDPSKNTLDTTIEILVPAAGGSQSKSTCQVSGKKSSP